MNRFPRWLIVALVLAFVLLLAGSTRFYYVQMRSLRQGAENDLQAIAQAKVDQIVTWRTERLADASVLMDSPFFAEAVARWMADPRTEVTEEILARFRALQVYYHYSDILLVDSGSQVRLTLSGRSGPLHKDAAQALSAAFRERRPVLTDLHEGADDQAPHIGTVVPLFNGSGQGPGMVGAVILECEARQYLYPLIQSWPIHSRSAETLLVRRDGDAVLFLNELRHQKGTALKLRIPLTQKEVPAVMAVLGREGVVEGKDYRGIEVLSVLKAIPDSPWFMVAKVDKAEALSVLRSESVFILAVILGFAVAAISAVGMVWQRNAKAYYRSLFQMEAARRESEERYRTTLMSVGDGVISTDAEGRVKFLNPAAEHLTGWSEIEAQGKSLGEVFRIINEETRAEVENPVERVLCEGLVVGLANHTVLIARDGTEHPIADCGSPVLDERGVITGVVLVFRDQTVERAAQKALRQSEERYRTLIESTEDAVYLIDREMRFLYANRRYLARHGLSLKDIEGLEYAKCHSTERTKEFSQKVEQVFESNKSVIYEHESEKDKRIFLRTLSPVRDPRTGEINSITVISKDITERKRAEETLRHEKEVLHTILDNIPVMVAFLDPDGHYKWVNKCWQSTLGWSLQEALETDVFAEFYPDPEYRKYVVDFIRSAESIWSDFRTRIREGRVLDTLWANVPLSDGSNIGIGIDITERKRAEEKIQASLQEKELMLQEIYHRVKNNLQVISSLLDLKSRNVRGKKAAEIFKECKTFVRAMSLVHEKFYQSGDLARINFKEYIESITKELVRAYYHAEKKITLEFDLEDISLEIGSAISCGLVLNELVTNSLKHAFPEGKHGELNVSLHAGEKNDIVLTVGDSGIGLPHGFNFRSSKSFGLNLVTGLVERQLMGKIELTESPGTEFRVTFQGKKARN